MICKYVLRFISFTWGSLKLQPPVPFTPAFPPPSVGVSASLFYFYCKMLRNIAKCFSFSPDSHHFGNPASRPFSSHFPYPSCPLLSRAPAPCPPPLWTTGPRTLQLLPTLPFTRSLQSKKSRRTVVRLPIVSNLKIIYIKILCSIMLVYSTDYEFKFCFSFNTRIKISIKVTNIVGVRLLDISVVIRACDWTLTKVDATTLITLENWKSMADNMVNFYKIRYILCKLALQIWLRMYGKNMLTNKTSNNGHGV